MESAWGRFGLARSVRDAGTHVDVFVVARPACQDHSTREWNFVRRSRSLCVGGHGCQSSRRASHSFGPPRAPRAHSRSHVSRGGAQGYWKTYYDTQYMYRDVPELSLLSVSLLVLLSESRSTRVKREVVGNIHLRCDICSTSLLSVSFLVLRCARVALSSCVCPSILGCSLFFF